MNLRPESRMASDPEDSKTEQNTSNEGLVRTAGVFETFYITFSAILPLSSSAARKDDAGNHQYRGV